MIDATIKVKEKKNSYSLKAKISKSEIENYLTSVEGIAELKKDILDIVSFELDNFILEVSNGTNSSEVVEQIEKSLETIQVIVEKGEYSLDEEKEVETAETGN